MVVLFCVYRVANAGGDFPTVIKWEWWLALGAETQGTQGPLYDGSFHRFLRGGFHIQF